MKNPIKKEDIKKRQMDILKLKIPYYKGHMEKTKGG